MYLILNNKKRKKKRRPLINKIEKVTVLDQDN